MTTMTMTMTMTSTRMTSTVPNARDDE
jgi:hypothetical protein